MRYTLLIAALKLALMWAPPVFDIVRVPSAAPAPKPEAPVPAPKPCVKLSKAKVHVRRLMFFTATWCGHCKPTERAVDAWKKDAKPRVGEHVEYEKINGDLYPARVAQWNVSGYPTLIVTVNGREVARHTGRMSTAGGVERFVSQEREPVRRVSVTTQHVLKPEFRDTERMRRHLLEDHSGEHSYTPAQIKAMTRDELFRVHDAVHGEVLR
jgi:thiol-disulfide isomerase/thioredoxin